MYLKSTHKTITSLVSEALITPLVIKIEMHWVCVLFIFIIIFGTDLWKKKKKEKKCTKRKSIIAIQF